MTMIERRCPTCGEPHLSADNDRCRPCRDWDAAVRRSYGALACGVYFLQSGPFIKIGVASNVLRRVRDAAWTWNPHEVIPIGWIPEPDYRAAYRLEAQLHAQFVDSRHRGEWFHLTAALSDYITANAEPWPTIRPEAQE